MTRDSTSGMIEPYRTYSTVGVGTAMLVFVVGAIATGASNPANPRTGELMWYGSLVLGLALWVWGCYCHARAKGYSGWLGGLGLLSLPGLVVLLMLRDRARSSEHPRNPS